MCFVFECVVRILYPNEDSGKDSLQRQTAPSTQMVRYIRPLLGTLNLACPGASRTHTPRECGQGNERMGNVIKRDVFCVNEQLFRLEILIIRH